MADSFTTAYDTAVAATSKEQLNSDIITGTLDTLNSNVYGGGKKKSGSSTQTAMNNTYDLSKSVLSAAYGKGITVSDKG